MNRDATDLSIEERDNLQVKTKEETDKKCPQCDGTMEFDPATGGMACPYCGYAEDVESGAAAKEIDFASATDRANRDWGTGKKIVSCKSCGAETVYDALEVANECPYCGSNQVMEVADKDTMSPGGVCPFRIEKKTAGDNFKSWLGNKWFCPSEAKKRGRPDAFHGIYLPYWTFDTQTESRYNGRYGIDRVESYRGSDGKTHSRTVTDWYSCSGHYSEFINDHAVLGTKRHDSGILGGILPFDTESNVAYKPQYLAGYAAERYSVGLDDAWKQGSREIYSHLGGNIDSAVRRKHNADRVDVTYHTRYDDLKFKYLLLPVWMSSFRYNGKVYQFMVNGQTGKVSGKYPISPIRVAIAVAVGLALAFGAWQLLSGPAEPQQTYTVTQGQVRQSSVRK